MLVSQFPKIHAKDDRTGSDPREGDAVEVDAVISEQTSPLLLPQWIVMP